MARNQHVFSELGIWIIYEMDWSHQISECWILHGHVSSWCWFRVTYSVAGVLQKLRNESSRTLATMELFFMRFNNWSETHLHLNDSQKITPNFTTPWSWFESAEWPCNAYFPQIIGINITITGFGAEQSKSYTLFSFSLIHNIANAMNLFPHYPALNHRKQWHFFMQEWKHLTTCHATGHNKINKTLQRERENYRERGLTFQRAAEERKWHCPRGCKVQIKFCNKITILRLFLTWVELIFIR